jgi:hypothetical protein
VCSLSTGPWDAEEAAEDVTDRRPAGDGWVAQEMLCLLGRDAGREAAGTIDPVARVICIIAGTTMVRHFALDEYVCSCTWQQRADKESSSGGVRLV